MGDAAVAVAEEDAHLHGARAAECGDEVVYDLFSCIRIRDAHAAKFLEESLDSRAFVSCAVMERSDSDVVGGPNESAPLGCGDYFGVVVHDIEEFRGVLAWLG